jgi:hypothetical protein
MLYLSSKKYWDFIRRYNMSDKNMEMMKKLLESKKQKQAEKQKHRPNNKMGSSSTGFKNMKTRGSNNKV